MHNSVEIFEANKSADFQFERASSYSCLRNALLPESLKKLEEGAFVEDNCILHSPRKSSQVRKNRAVRAFYLTSWRTRSFQNYGSLVHDVSCLRGKVCISLLRSSMQCMYKLVSARLLHLASRGTAPQKIPIIIMLYNAFFLVVSADSDIPLHF